MKKPALLFTLKCAAILYFAACTNIDKLTVSKSASAILTGNGCKVNLYLQGDNDQTNDLSGYKLQFTEDGNLKAVKNDVVLNGNWHEDDLNKTLLISFDTEDRNLDKLNYKWNITKISGNAVAFESDNESGTEKLNITNE